MSTQSAARPAPRRTAPPRPALASPRGPASKPIGGPPDARPRRRAHAVPHVPDDTDLLARQHELENERGNCVDADALAPRSDLRQLHQDFYGPDLVFRLH